MKKIAKFDSEVVYIFSTENILSDALSCLYTHNKPGTVGAWSEYTYHNIIDNDSLGTLLISMPLLIGAEGMSMGIPAELSLSSVEAGPSQSLPSAFSTTSHTVPAHLLPMPCLPIEPGPSHLMASDMTVKWLCMNLHFFCGLVSAMDIILGHYNLIILLELMV